MGDNLSLTKRRYVENFLELRSISSHLQTSGFLDRRNEVRLHIKWEDGSAWLVSKSNCACELIPTHIETSEDAPRVKAGPMGDRMSCCLSRSKHVAMLKAAANSSCRLRQPQDACKWNYQQRHNSGSIHLCGVNTITEMTVCVFPSSDEQQERPFSWSK